MPKGNYRLKLYKIAYKSNDPYATYAELVKPSQLTNKQLNEIKSKNAGKPFISEIVK